MRVDDVAVRESAIAEYCWLSDSADGPFVSATVNLRYVIYLAATAAPAAGTWLDPNRDARDSALNKSE